MRSHVIGTWGHHSGSSAMYVVLSIGHHLFDGSFEPNQKGIEEAGGAVWWATCDFAGMLIVCFFIFHLLKQTC